MIALSIAGIAVVGALATATTLIASATGSIAAAGLGEPATSTVDQAVLPGVTALSEPSAAPAAPAVVDELPRVDGPPRYDASTDIATIPRPPADWPAGELANAEVWLEQQGIIGDCMLELGYDYVFTPWWLIPLPKPGEPVEPIPANTENWDGDFSSPKGVALWGEPDRGLGDDYDWREAGCDGYAVHVTGMDNAN